MSGGIHLLQSEDHLVEMREQQLHDSEDLLQREEAGLHAFKVVEAALFGFTTQDSEHHGRDVNGDNPTGERRRRQGHRPRAGAETAGVVRHLLDAVRQARG
jgi:hypothetical protein